MNLQLIRKLAPVAALAISLPACMPPPPQYVDNPAFAQRAPPPGRLSYLETIKYIDDGLRYVDPTTGFFVSADGRMCFRGALSTNFDYFYKSDWCVLPTAVSQVDSIRTGEVSLTCNHADPQCIREIGYRYQAVNTIAMRIVPSDQEKAAVEHLIYLMGGNLGDSMPFAGPATQSRWRRPGR